LPLDEYGAINFDFEENLAGKSNQFFNSEFITYRCCTNGYCTHLKVMEGGKTCSKKSQNKSIKLYWLGAEMGD
jgi:hypothetical protein